MNKIWNPSSGGWGRFIQLLESDGLCLARKAEGLREWPDTGRILTPHGVLRLYTGINHIKLTFENGVSPDDEPVRRAKAYLAVSYLLP